MDEKIIKVTEKGQISIPSIVRESLSIYSGDKLLVSRSEDVIILKKIKDENFSDLLKHSENSLKKVWDNEEDEIWSNYLE